MTEELTPWFKAIANSPQDFSFSHCRLHGQNRLCQHIVKLSWDLLQMENIALYHLYMICQSCRLDIGTGTSNTSRIFLHSYNPHPIALGQRDRTITKTSCQF